jgi:outer membrane protein insertion porin family
LRKDDGERIQNSEARIQKNPPAVRQRRDSWIIYIIDMAKRIFIFILFILLWQATVWAEDLPKVAVFPFRINSRENLSYLKQGLAEMLSTRLERDKEIATMDKFAIQRAISSLKTEEIDETTAKALGVELSADLVILGSFTKIGETISVDTTIIEVKGEKPITHIFKTVPSMEEVPSKMIELAKEANLKILNKVLITKLQIKGNKYIEDAAIRLNLKSKEGEVFSPKTLEQDLKNVYQMGYFRDIQIETEDRPEGKTITFVVVEKPTVKEIKIVGNEKVKTDDIQKVIGMKPKYILDEKQIKEDVEKIKKVYSDKGFYSAEIASKISEPTPDEAVVTYQIKEYEVSKIAKISFTGNKAIPSKELKKVMSTKEKNILSLITSAGIFKEDALQKDIDQLTAFYYNQGYIQVKVGNPEIKHEKNKIFITIPIDEGKQFKVGPVDITGNILGEKSSLSKDLKTVSGKVFSSNSLHDDIVKLTDLYADQGYAYADISPLTKINPENQTVDVAFDIEQGEKVYIEKINISGNTRTRDKVIRREIRLAEGEIYSTSKLKRSKQEVNNLGYFKEVNFTTNKGSANDKIVVNVAVEERPTGSFSLGAGYSSVDNLVGMFQISQNNLFGKGQQLTLQANIGGSTTRFNLSFTEPWFRDTRTSAGFDAFKWEREYEDFDKDSTGGDIRFGFPVADFTRLYLSYKYEMVDISNIDEDASHSLREEEGKSNTSSVIGTIVKDSRNDKLMPTSGVLNSLTLELAGLGGDNHFATVVGSLSKYWPLPHDTSFMVRGTLGYEIGFAGDSVPIFERFFLGGLDSLRGFEARSVGPEEDGDVIGGTKEAILNFEYLFPIMKEAGIRGVVFFDTGNAYRKDQYPFETMRKSAGFGVRWYSPFGPLRVEWGINLSPRSGEKRSNFEFSMGNLF